MPVRPQTSTKSRISENAVKTMRPAVDYTSRQAPVLPGSGAAPVTVLRPLPQTLAEPQLLATVSQEGQSDPILTR
jgi:hypothetical protein